MQQSITNIHKITVALIPPYSATTTNMKTKQITKSNTTKQKKDKTTLRCKPKQRKHKLQIQTPTETNTPTIMSKTDVKKLIENNNLFPPEIPVKSAIGKYGLMWPRGIAFAHDAAPLLTSYSEKGCPTDCGPQWTKEHIIAAITRGAHPTAKIPIARRYLINQTMAKVHEKFAKVIKWGDIKNNIPKNLKISPIAMIPHKSRDYRSILDLSFQLRIKGKLHPSVNKTTNKLAPQKAMAGLGKALQRIVQTLADNYNTTLPFKFAKCDIKDGFWRMIVNEEDSWNFCYTIPPPSKHTPIDEIEIVVPTSLQMGWCESPPFFCAATETGRDIIEELFKRLHQIPPHPMEHWMIDGTLLKQPNHPKITKDLVEVYVDDFITGTNQLDNTHLTQLSRAVLHGIHCIFPPTNISKHCGGDPISEKKMEKGDGTWHFQKEILGWIFDGKAFTIFLPSEKSKKIQLILKQLAKKESCTLNEFQKVAGKLNHACIGLPSGRGLLSPVNNAMQGSNEVITITPPIKQALCDWIVLLQIISTRPTSVLELTAGYPWFLAYVDASKYGVGGVWISGTMKITATVWRLQWPPEIQKQLVSSNNRKGKISISDLEMAGVLLAWMVLEQISPVNLTHAHIGIFCDNTPAVAWATKLASSKSVVGGHLCRALALRQHVHRASPILTVSIAGIKNDMADVASRAAKQTATNTQPHTFLSMFNKKFPLPQSNSWHLYQLPDKLFSRVTSCLHGQQLTMASWMRLPKQDKNIGLTGPIIQNPLDKTHSSTDSVTCTSSSSSQLSLRGSGQATSVEEIKSEFRPSLKRYRQLQRPSNWLANQAQSTKQKGYTKSQWHGSWKDTDGKTHPPSHSWQFPSMFHEPCNQKDTPPNAPKQEP